MSKATPNSTAQNVQAAGRVLAKRNADKLRAAFGTIAEILMDAGLVSANDLEEIADRGESDPEPAEPVAAAEATEAADALEIAAGDFKEMMNRISWDQRLRTAIDIFGGRFSHCLRKDDPKAIDELVADLNEVLAELRKDYIPPSEDYNQVYPMYLSAAEEADGLQQVTLELTASSLICGDASDDIQNVNRRPVEGVLFKIDQPSEAIPSVGPKMPLYIPRAVAESLVPHVAGLPLDAHDTLTKHANEEIAGVMMAGSIDGDDFKIRGVLWPWNKSAKVTAIVAASDRLGMSMNAAAVGHPETLPGSDQEVFHVDRLVLLGANILYSDRATFKQTKLIAAQDAALAEESVLLLAEQLDLETEELELQQAAAVLLRLSEDDATDLDEDIEDAEDEEGESVTDTDTETDDPNALEAVEDLDAENNDLDDADLIEPGEDEQEFSDGEPLDNPPDFSGDSPEMATDPHVLAQLEAISLSLSSLSSLSSLVERQQDTLDDMQDQLNEIQRERQVQAASVQAAEAQQTSQAERQSLVSEITSAVLQGINPTGSPRRRTAAMPIAAGAAGAPTQTNEQMQLQIQLASLTGRLSEIRRNPVVDGTEELKLVDEIRGIQTALGQAPSVF